MTASPSAGVAAERETPAATNPHTMAALLGGILFLGGLAAVYLLGQWVTARSIYALAEAQDGLNYAQLVLQREALRHRDLLPLYGTSEIFRPLDNPYHAQALFADAPTGFSIFALGMPGGLVLTSMQSLGALGADLNGKKVVISLSPPMFAAEILDVRYAASFSALQALTLLLSHDLSPELKSDVAKRYLAHPSMLQRNRITDLMMNLYVDASPFYNAVVPFAYVERLLLNVVDRAGVISYVVRVRPGRSTVKRHDLRRLDWAALLADATREYQPQASANPFGVSDRWWRNNKSRVEGSPEYARESDEQFLHELNRSEAWLDLEPMLRILQELRAQAMILSMPLHGSWWDYARVSPAARRQYYVRVRELGARYGVRTVVLDDLESDHYFFRDLGSHPSAIGWVHYDRAIDAFYHDALN
jgi:D-alanine transfer protein